MRQSYFMLLFVLVFFSCKTKTSEKDTDTRSQAKEDASLQQTPSSAAPSGNKAVDVSKSSIDWKGYKIIGNHTGKIDIKRGNIVFDNGNITSGEFVIDMNSIKVTELMDEKDKKEADFKEKRQDLADHLMDEDFFESNTFPEARFVITKSQKTGEKYEITGDMTIKDVTKPISLVAVFAGDVLKSEVSIDRTDFGVKYGSDSFFDNLGDRVIKDKFDLVISLFMKK